MSEAAAAMQEPAAWQERSAPAVRQAAAAPAELPKPPRPQPAGRQAGDPQWWDAAVPLDGAAPRIPHPPQVLSAGTAHWGLPPWEPVE